MPNSQSDKYLVSGHALNSIFGTKHNDPDKMWLVSAEGIFPFSVENGDKSVATEVNYENKNIV